MTSFELIPIDDLEVKQTEIRELLRTLPVNDAVFNSSITVSTSDKKQLEYRLCTWNQELTRILQG
jgi:hypothetical protein